MFRVKILSLTRYLVPIAALLIALNQLYHANFHTLTPWKGGGFGMFSSIRGISERRMLATPENMPDSLSGYFIEINSTTLKKIGWNDDDFRSFRSYPTQSELEVLGKDLLNLSYSLGHNDYLNVLAERADTQTGHLVWVANRNRQKDDREKSHQFTGLLLVVEQLAWDPDKEVLYYEELLEAKVLR